MKSGRFLGPIKNAWKNSSRFHHLSHSLLGEASFDAFALDPAPIRRLLQRVKRLLERVPA